MAEKMVVCFVLFVLLQLCPILAYFKKKLNHSSSLERCGQTKKMAVFFFIAHEKGFKLHPKLAPQTGTPNWRMFLFFLKTDGTLL